MENDITLETPARIHLVITGRVQNVGFRSYVQKVAASLSINGWVRNVRYDQVEVTAEGVRLTLEQFLRLVKIGPRGSHIDDVEISYEEFSGEFSEFGIRTSH
jgi:acylphosphatase